MTITYSLPPQAIHCKLHGVCPAAGEAVWPEDCSEYFEELLNVANTVIITAMGVWPSRGVAPIKGEGQNQPLPVQVMVGTEDIASTMIARGKATCDSKSRRVRDVVTVCCPVAMATLSRGKEPGFFQDAFSWEGGGGSEMNGSVHSISRVSGILAIFKSPKQIILAPY